MLIYGLVRQRITTGKGIEPISEEEILQMKERQIAEKVEKLKATEIVKTAQSHTDKELRNMVIGRDKIFVQRCLTQEGREQIKRNYRIVEQENEQDKMLRREMQIADLSREYGIRVKILGKDDLAENKEEEQILIARESAQRFRKNWTPITEIPLQQQMPYEQEEQDR